MCKKRLLASLFIFAVLTLASTVNTTLDPEWGADTQLTTDPAYDWNPSGGGIMQDATEKIWVVWASSRTGNYDIWYKTSPDGGSTWSADTQLTTDPNADDYPSIMQAANGSIWVAWAREIIGPPYQWDLYYKTSSDGGANWSSETQLTTDSGFDLTPSITQTVNGTIWVAWNSDRILTYDPDADKWIPQDDIFYKTSSDGGANWSADTQLTTDPKDDTGPSVTQSSDGKIWLVWVSDRFGWRNLFYATSSDGGVAWTTDTELTTYEADDWSPSITETSDGKIWVVFHSQRGGNWDIYYKMSLNGGGTWSADTQLTTNPSFDVVPSMTQTADERIWVVWASYRTGNYDIWYKTVTHDVAITSITPSSTLVTPGEIVSIDVVAANQGTETENFTVTAYVDTIVVGSTDVVNLPGGISINITFNWNTTGVASGNYTVKAEASVVSGETDTVDNMLTDGTVYVRIPGDIDGDGDVDYDDLVILAGAYGSSSGDPAYDERADFDHDGDVDYDDLVVLAGNYG